tara:strand:+ start:286 stop:828 length:543 start_codon:yes stop_codon:yes gene_type:complete
MEKNIHNINTDQKVITEFEVAIANIDIDGSSDSECNNIGTGEDYASIEIEEAPIPTHVHTSEYLYDTTREKIKSRLNKTIEFDIKDSITWRFLWRKGGNISEGLSLIASLSSTVLSFSSGAFNNTTLAFIAGCLGSISIALMRASSYALKESIEREDQLNILLEKAHITQVPSLIKIEDI